MAVKTVNSPRFFRRVALLILIACLAASFAHAGDYTLTKLPDTFPIAINSSGQLAGLGPSFHNSTTSFFWTRIGGFQVLPDLGGGKTIAASMNDSGAIVGESTLPNGVPHAFLWTQAAGMKDLGSPLGGRSSADYINAAGQVLGFSVSPDESMAQIFFWSSATGSVEILTTGINAPVNALGMNSSGVVVGSKFGQAYRWSLGTGLEILPFSMANAINDSGQIAGSNLLTGHEPHAYLWSPDGTAQDLGVLPGEGASSGLFVNIAGHVAGWSSLSDIRGKNRTFFWTPAGIVDIGILPGHTNSSIPVGLNNRDQIVGVNGGTFLWSVSTGLVHIPGVTLPFDLLFQQSFNDAGQILGMDQKQTNVIVASPTMHVSLSSSLNPSHAGENVTLTASVSAIVGLPPDGEQVTFKDGTKILGTAILSNGIATLATSALTAKTHSISATYVGDNNYISGKSTPLKQIVNP